jgi:hypothetical protein
MFVFFVLENFKTTNIWSVMVPKEFQTNTHGSLFKVQAYTSAVQMQPFQEILDDQDERCL